MDKSSPRKNYLTSPIRIRKFTFPDKNGIVGSGGLAGGARGGGKGGGGLAGEEYRAGDGNLVMLSGSGWVNFVFFSSCLRINPNTLQSITLQRLD